MRRGHSHAAVPIVCRRWARLGFRNMIQLIVQRVIRRLPKVPSLLLTGRRGGRPRSRRPNVNILILHLHPYFTYRMDILCAEISTFSPWEPAKRSVTSGCRARRTDHADHAGSTGMLGQNHDPATDRARHVKSRDPRFGRQSQRPRYCGSFSTRLLPWKVT